MLRLYVDESGTKDFNDPHSEYFIVVGVIVDTAHASYIRHYAQFIKKKHFGIANKVLHANEILKDNAKGLKTSKPDFYDDLLFFLGEARFEVIGVAVHKPSYKKKGFRPVNVHNDAYLALFKAYTRRIITKAKKNQVNRGQLCLEQAALGGDLAIHKIFSDILSGKWSKFGFGTNIVRKYIVSLKFVTKHNLDTEVQLADMLAYAYAKYKSSNYRDKAQQDVLERIVRLAKKRRFMFTDFEVGKRMNSFIDLS